ncbi:MAG: hypothetical protein H5T85_03690 [Actinobacteria bacterium]|nr:hypothetical protein [Actinomycetota bacterium]
MIEYIYLQPVHKDFHIVLNFLIEFLRENYGEERLEDFFVKASRYIYQPLIQRVKNNGIVEIEKHLRAIFTKEDGEFHIGYKGQELIFEVIKCPAIWYMKANKIEISKCYCKISTEIVTQIIMKECGYCFSVEYDQHNGRCIQKFWKEDQNDFC